MSEYLPPPHIVEAAQMVSDYMKKNGYRNWILGGIADAALFDYAKCRCADSTGWVEIRCCNLCGLPHADETLPWKFNFSYSSAPPGRGRRV